MSVCQNSLVKRGSRSDTNLVGSPNWLYTLSRKMSAVPLAVMALVARASRTRLVSIHTNVTMVSYSLPSYTETGRSVMKSMLIAWKGRSGTAWGSSKPGGFCEEGLVYWQVGHDST